MTLHREGKGTIIVSLLVLTLLSAISHFFLGRYSVLVTLPLLILFCLVVWFFRVPNRNISEHTDKK